MCKDNLAALFDVIDKLDPEEVKKELKEKFLPWWNKYSKENPRMVIKREK